MFKSSGPLVIIFLLLTLITGCTEPASTEVKDAIKAAEKYKNVEYTLKASEDILSQESAQHRNEQMEPFFTETFYKKATATRYTLLPLQVSHTQKLSLKPTNLQFNLQEQKTDIIVLDYSFDLLLLDQKGKESKRIPLEGILTLSNVKGHWLIQGDRFDDPAFMKLIEK